MRTHTALGILALLVVVGVIVFYAASRPTSVRAPVPSSYSEHTQYYDITAQLATSTPLLQSAGVKADAVAVTLMKNFVSETIVQFKTDGNFANLTSEDIQTLGLDQGRKETLQINHVIASGAHTVSYIYTIYTDTLGAHGNTYYRTFTFNLEDGEPLLLSDLFVKDSPYLETLSVQGRSMLPDIIGVDMYDENMAKAGTEPETINFENFFLDDISLVILFPPYAVAAYAAGPQTLAIPTSELKDILKPEFQ
ncbi:hypothetical protein A2678_00335 [Candidatus Kaiserbacteria bacterium RIFCSPHIGHO2_01_FULL_53_31]|uniref:DUF3298 domain-containing protein n=1 Tax=Candidatus Kaiserbacteria bacterium RIFCSPHIGHO2_01_FULL_53_31 TaxID=1798481 RepID=A0A1F6CIH0_9BACT|nr:MAG: hypothetical protein A2678_00335 [Candidatus Kaiserbacteria bacterium RIFCSPHIGHO2_01_FULL_53_31]